MSKTVTTQTIEPDFLSRRDQEYLSELVHDWLRENDKNVESFSFNIEVSWENNNDQH